jgi:hypothetical protein
VTPSPTSSGPTYMTTTCSATGGIQRLTGTRCKTVTPSPTSSVPVVHDHHLQDRWGCSTRRQQLAREEVWPALSAVQTSWKGSDLRWSGANMPPRLDATLATHSVATGSCMTDHAMSWSVITSSQS